MAQLDRIPTVAELARYDVNRRGMEEGVKQSLYDYQTWGGSGVGLTQYNFFQVPVGQSSKTKADTNMTNAGMLPAPQAFLVQSIEIIFRPAVEILRYPTASADVDGWMDDLDAALNGVGYLEFTIGSKPYLTEAPLVRFPPKARLRGSFGLAGTLTAQAMFIADHGSAEGRPYFIDPPLLIPATQNFNVQVNFPTAITLPTATNARWGVILDGILYRLSQ